MILFKRTVKLRNGKQMKAVEFCGKVAGYLSENHGFPVRLLRNSPGNQRELHFHIQFDSMAALEEWGDKVNAEPAYQALVKEAVDKKYYDDVEDYIYTYMV